MKKEFATGTLLILLIFPQAARGTSYAGEGREHNRVPAGTGLTRESFADRTTGSMGNTLTDRAATIVTREPLPHYTTYQEGSYLAVEIPAQQNPRVQVEKAERGLDNVRIRKRGDVVIISFPLPEGAFAQVHQRENRLEITLAAEAPSSIEEEATVASAELQSEGPTVPQASTPAAPSSLIDPATVAVGSLVEPDLSVPESPGFTVLGVTPQTVIRPSSPRALGMALLNGVDREGNFQTGIAIDTAPFLLFAGHKFTLDEYRTHYLSRMLARTQLSLATTKGADEEDESARVAFGLHVTPWDRGDPRYDDKLIGCFRTELSFDLPGSTEEQETLLRNKWKRCHEDARQRNWNRSSWVLGGAPSWRAPKGNFHGLRWDGGGVWSSVAYGFEEVPLLRNTSQLIFHARYRDAEYSPDPANKGKFLRHDSIFLGARLRVGIPKLIANVEGVFIRDDPEGRRSDDLYRLSFGGELRLTDDLWLSVTVGGEGGRHNGKNQAFALTTFKYAFPRGPRE